MTNLTKKAIKQDINEFQKKLEEIHPNPYKYILKKDFHTLLESKTKNVKSIRDLGLAIISVLPKLKDGHTQLELSYDVFGAKSFMFQFKFFNDGYYLIKSSKTLSEFLGYKLTRINNFPIDDIENIVTPLIPQENETSTKYYLSSKLMEPVILDYLNIKKDENIKLQLENQKEKTSIEISPEDSKIKMISMLKNIPKVDESLKVRKPYWFKHMLDLKSFYFQYNECTEMEDLSISEVIKIFKKSSLLNLIIDLRNNKGGDSEVLKPLIEFLRKYKGKYKTFVLTGADMYSSAVINLIELSDIPNTISIGEIPHGNPTHYGEVEIFILPNSKLKVFSSSKLFRFKGYKLGEPFKPTHIVNTKIQDLLLGKDTQIEYLSNML
ncbi:MAG: Peptidase S41 [candidate division WS6 bacterium 34_10]|jgi:hypothetical protein|uniref:Peptidase S41 n=1 Tax=candidate division WS6 bacterium 34_10 TaxID=1641389 RepID=A0A101HJ08_9BACT|nr:MAG: Peptidase S41 [candidate division WS6 bacterium 34_10]MDY6822119.1 hypothetical protein [Deferribacterota bacterium]